LIAEAIRVLVDGNDLAPPLVEGAVEDILSGRASPAQIAAFVVALRMKGETTIEITAAARVMRRHCDAVEVVPDERGVLLDTCGTGGDSLGTFNISTMAALVVAACGVRVAKHGNRAVSSRAGSADVLEALGVTIELPKGRVVRCIEEVGVGFLFAQRHHGALRHAATVRKELGVRTLFNLLGPLANPASVTHQVVGIYDPARLVQIAEVLAMLGTERAWVVHGDGGLDEISLSGPTRVAELHAETAGLQGGSRVELRTVTPEDFGVARAPLSALVGGDASENAAIARAILSGEAGPRRDAVVINAAAAVWVAGRATDLLDAARMAGRAIDDGRAARMLERLVEHTRGLG
jgi:anthranilate phosphoribosyltransferase